MKSPIIQNVILLLVCTTIASTTLVNAKCCGRPSKPVSSKPVLDKPVSVVEQIKEKITKILGGKQDNIVIKESNDAMECEQQCSNGECIKDETTKDTISSDKESDEIFAQTEIDKENSEVVTKELSVAEVITVVNKLITEAINIEESKTEQALIAKEEASLKEELVIIENIV